MQRIADAYREHGYYQATASYQLSWNETRDEVAIAIDVVEGPAVTLESWTIDLGELPGDPARWPKLLLADLPLEKGAVFTVALYGTAKRTLAQRMWDLGFADATVSGGGEVDLATETAQIDRIKTFRGARDPAAAERALAAVRTALTIRRRPLPDTELQKSQRRSRTSGCSARS
jgi:outer membrane protein assembly factor BamA